MDRRKLVAILAADVARYSILMADDEAATLRSLNEARDIFRKRVEAHGGKLIDTAYPYRIPQRLRSGGSFITLARPKAPLIHPAHRIRPGAHWEKHTYRQTVARVGRVVSVRGGLRPQSLGLGGCLCIGLAAKTQWNEAGG